MRTLFRPPPGVARAVAVLGLAFTVAGAGIGCSARARPAAPTAVGLATAPDQFFISDDARLRYREAGTGEAVVLLHGMAAPGRLGGGRRR